MTKIFATLLFLACLSTSIFAQEKPLIKLNVTVNGKPFTIYDGDSIQYQNTNIVIKTSNYLTFNFEGIRFDYPSYLSFQSTKNDGVNSYTLDGNDLVLSYHIFDAAIDFDLFVGELVKQFGKKNCKVENRKIRLGSEELTGKRINVELIGAKLTYDIFPIILNDSKTHFISFQDSKKDDGSDSDDFKETMEVVQKTIEYKK